jgi:GNAT superfamily N-acetyltransferase
MIREATTADREAILRLRARCFGDVDREKADPPFWDWEFSRGRCFIDDDQMTHFAIIAAPYRIDGRIVPGGLAVDAMTAPEARGRGLFTQAVTHAMEATRGDFALSTAYQIRSSVLGAMLRGGWTVATKVPVLIRPVIFAKSTDTSVCATHTDKSVCATHTDKSVCATRELTRDDCPLMASIAEAMPGDGASVARTAEWLAWRFFDNPHWRYRVTAFGDDAYLVARRTTLKGYDTFAIVDLAWRNARAARRLVRDAVAEGRARGCRLIAALVSRSHPAFPMLLARGFLPGPHWFRLLVYPAAFARKRWRVMWADTDHL